MPFKKCVFILTLKDKELHFKIYGMEYVLHVKLLILLENIKAILLTINQEM